MFENDTIQPSLIRPRRGKITKEFNEKVGEEEREKDAKSGLGSDFSCNFGVSVGLRPRFDFSVSNSDYIITSSSERFPPPHPHTDLHAHDTRARMHIHRFAFGFLQRLSHRSPKGIMTSSSSLLFSCLLSPVEHRMTSLLVWSRRALISLASAPTLPSFPFFKGSEYVDV